MKILHVTECFAGGVSRAINSRVAATPGYEHHLLWASNDSPASAQGFFSSTELPTGFARRVLKIRSHIAKCKPDIVHAHSSWAGVYTRLLPSSVPVVYEPHCYKFDDPNLDKLRAWLFKAAERQLASRTAAFGVLSAHEKALTNAMAPENWAIRIPNVPTISSVRDGATSVELSKVAMVGRLCGQKDPLFFAEVVQELRNLKVPLAPVWVGDGEPEFKNLLTRANIPITGWVDNESLALHLSNAAYVHTAAYEGFPLSVLDAAARNAPIVARSIPALSEYPLLQADSPSGVASLLRDLVVQSSKREQAASANQALLAAHNTTELTRGLEHLYELAVRS